MKEGIQLGPAQSLEIDSLNSAITPQVGHQVRYRLTGAAVPIRKMVPCPTR